MLMRINSISNIQKGTIRKCYWVIIWFKCFCCSIKQKAEELLLNICLKITLVEKLRETQLAENLNFYSRQVLYLKYPRTKKVLKVSVVWGTKSFKSTVLGIFKVVESRVFWSRFLVLLGHMRNLQGKHAIGSLQLLFLQTIWNTIMKKIVHLFLLLLLKYRGNFSTTAKPLI